MLYVFLFMRHFDPIKLLTYISIMYSSKFYPSLVILIIICSIVSNCFQVEEFELKDLCNTTSHLEHNYTVKLNSSVQYTISKARKGFCLISDIDITITSDTDDLATINCAGISSNTSQESTWGLAFVNSTVTIERVVFKKCGTYLRSLPNKLLDVFTNTSISSNHTRFFYPTNYSALLYFFHCEVKMSTVKLESTHGFAVIGFNFLDSSLKNIDVNSSISIDGQTIGNGILIIFAEGTMTRNDRSFKAFIENCRFLNNVVAVPPLTPTERYPCVREIYSINHTESYSLKPILYSATLSIFYIRKFMKAQVVINNSHFLGNFAYGKQSSILRIVHFDSNTEDTNTVIRNCLFSYNTVSDSEKCPEDAVISFIFIFNVSVHKLNRKTIIPLLIEFTNFTSEQHFIEQIHNRHGALYLGVVGELDFKLKVILRHTLFENNLSESGVCLVAETSFQDNMQIKLESVSVRKNKINMLSPVSSSSALFTLTGVTCIINGTQEHPSEFRENYGIVFVCLDSTSIHMYGTVIFADNQAIRGSALNLEGDSRLYFMNGLNATFVNNKASSLGGAIYAVVHKKMSGMCAFIFQSIDPNNNIINVNFINNSAIDGGSSIYAYPLSDCYLQQHHSHYVPSITTGLKVYTTLFNFEVNSNENLDMSTLPMKITGTYHNQISIYLGESINLCLSAKDVFGRNVYAAVKSEIALERVERDLMLNHITLSFHSIEQVIHEIKQCSNITLKLLASKYNNKAVRRTIFVYAPSSVEAYSVDVYLKECPLGFSFNHKIGACDCSNPLHQLYASNSVSKHMCSIQTQTFTRLANKNSWAGVIQIRNESAFAVSDHCPFEYCYNSEQDLDWFYSVNNEIFLKQNPHSTSYFSICDKGRTGTLCGKCVNGSTLVFGSEKCTYCDSKLNYWLFISLIAFIGPLLIFMLFVLKLTLTGGTLAGVIFYVNIVASGFLTYYLAGIPIGNQDIYFLLKVTIHFITLTNLNFGFPICFTGNMTALWKYGLSGLFPFYLLFIVVVLIFASRHSSWLSNKILHSSVQVLVTIVHISFNNLLLLMTSTFSYTKIYTTDEKPIIVWSIDGSVKFLSDPGHIGLTVLHLVTILPLILSYLIFLLLGKCLIQHLQRCKLVLRHVYEAIHAPYKQGKEYWFALRQLTLVLVWILNFLTRLIGLTSTILTTAVVLCLLLIGTIKFHPYRNRVLSLLDTWILLNLIVVYGGALILPNNTSTMTMIFTITTTLVFITFILILLYHLLLVTGFSQRLKRLLPIQIKLTSCVNHLRCVVNSSFTSQNHSLQHLVNSDSFTGSCEEFREPLLDTDNNA